MPGRAAAVIDLPRVTAFVERAARTPTTLFSSALPFPLARGALTSWPQLFSGLLGLGGRLRVYLEEYQGRLGSAALVYNGRRPEWVILLLAVRPGPSGESAFRLLSHVSAAAARSGMHRLFAAVPDEARARESFFQAGFYSYTRESWYVADHAPRRAPSKDLSCRVAGPRDAHDLFRFYAMTTPHAVQRAEQLTVEDFDMTRRAGAYDPPHLIGGNPLVMRRACAFIDGDELRPRGFALGFRGTAQHPHVCKVRTADGDVDLAQELVRATTRELPADRPFASPVRSYEEHVARALVAEGFEEAATAMLFVKELAVRIEEPAFAPAVVR